MRKGVAGEESNRKVSVFATSLGSAQPLRIGEPSLSRSHTPREALEAAISCAINDCSAIIAIMASITIRQLPEITKRKLRMRAARNGRSMEQEARELSEECSQPARACPSGSWRGDPAPVCPFRRSGVEDSASRTDPRSRNSMTYSDPSEHDPPGHQRSF
jgi:hypothetical protein